jgi:perosamine synthetase
MISVYNPDIKSYSKSAIAAIESGWISNHGEYVSKTAELLQSKMGVTHSILMSNGTCATHCLFLAVKYKYPEIKKIYVPNNCYIAAINSALMEYDKSALCVMKMDEHTWNINTDEEYVQRLDPNSAVLIVHNMGNIINVPRLKRIRPDLIFVEDNCEGLFGKYEGIYSGTSAATLCSSVSFYGNKTITSGEGGAFLTQDEEVYHYIKRVYSQGMSDTKFLHDVHAYNYRMTNVQAAFLYDQLNDIDCILSNKRKVFKTYTHLLLPLVQRGKVKVFELEPDTENADWIFAIRIVGNPKSISETNQFFNENGIDIRPFFYPINKHAHFIDMITSDETADVLNREVIMIPSSPTITQKEQGYVVAIVASYIDKFVNTHILPVSLGEAIDKLTILDIKCSEIRDGRKAEVMKEYNMLMEKLKPYVNRYIKLYETMKRTNKVIWDMMDTLRDGDKENPEYLTVCKKCIEYNDIRFRIKSKINYISNSVLKEQKSYKVTRIYIRIPNKIENISVFINPIRHLSFIYDEIHIYANTENMLELSSVFNYDPTILFYGVDPDVTGAYDFTETRYTHSEICATFKISEQEFDI